MQDMTVSVRAPAKVNLYLAVGAPRPDGYHPLATVFQAVDLYDTVTVRPADEITLQMGGIGAHLPTDYTNLAMRAAVHLAEFADVEEGADIFVEKRIPIAGGMAGGSADAAGTLVALDRLWALGLSQEQLLRIGAELGADVPFCLMGGTALGMNRGDELTPLLSRGKYSWVFVTQEAGLSTPDVFRRFDLEGPEAPEVPEVDTRFLAALAQGDTEFVARHAQNDLGECALAMHTDARAIMDACHRASLPAIVSGSGPTIAVFVSQDECLDSLTELMQEAVPTAQCVAARGPVPGAHVV
ncbi:MAG: 4-(cytidine 5'-diphospho)-2-C-methyl-D-erythritol kinase [bacterium]|nr:4-(cytidine 5'-diphospho)-2-C-methyl-D-erythritol kinase [bacterium]